MYIADSSTRNISEKKYKSMLNLIYVVKITKFIYSKKKTRKISIRD